VIGKTVFRANMSPPAEATISTDVRYVEGRANIRLLGKTRNRKFSSWAARGILGDIGDEFQLERSSCQ
jgi:hypothetical protein